MDQQELLDNWVSNKIKKFPHIKKFMEKAITTKMIKVENGQIEMAIEFIQKLHTLEKQKK